MLEIKNLSKHYGQKVAVKDLTLEIKSGELFCLIGPNGSGKTTLIKTILGLLRPTQGRVSIEGIDVQKHQEKAKAFCGYIPDEPTGWGNITGEEFLHMVGALYGVSEKQRKVKIPDLLKIFSVEEEAVKYFEEYSRGNKQKFAILAALLHEPKVLLVDEPIVGLDPLAAEAAKQAFVDHAKKGNVVLMVTHTLPVAQEIATRIGFIKNGELKAEGTLAELEQKLHLSNTADLEEVYTKLAKGV